MDTSSAKRALAPTTALFPVPLVLVTCGDIAGDMNAITLAWAGIASSEPPHLAIGVRPTRYSYGLIQRYSDFVVNLPGFEQMPVLEYCGSASGRNEDKFRKAALTPVKADIVRAPLLKEFKVNIECKVRQKVSLGSHDLFIGEVVAVHADLSLVVDGNLDPARLGAVAYAMGRHYRMGDRV